VKIAPVLCLLALMIPASCNDEGRDDTSGAPDGREQEAGRSRSLDAGIHDSPEKLARAMFRGLKEDDLELMVNCYLPERRERAREDLQRMGREDLNAMTKQIWGVGLSELNLSRLKLVIQKDFGDEIRCDVSYDGKLSGDTATFVRVGDKWYIEMW
jgi:hypothetical protein